MRYFYVACMAILLSSCGMTMPSFYDSNQSSSIIDIRQSIVTFDCAEDHLSQIQKIKKNIQWLVLYSEAKPSQKDVLNLLQPMQETTEDFYNRTESSGQGSEFYCNTKKKILQEQSLQAAEAIMRRF